MKRILIVAALVALETLLANAATTWYIRDDGGTRQQCTGTTNAPYPGSGTAQPCAFNHPFWLITDNVSTWAWIIAGGDTVIFEPDASGKMGTYYIGQTGGGSRPGSSWTHCTSDAADCTFPTPIPAGTSGAPTRILGSNAAALGGTCHNAARTQVVGAPTLSGVNGVFYIFSLQGTSWVDIECLDITDQANCTQDGSQGGQCVSGTDDWASNGIFLQYLAGTQGPANATLKDISIHGLGADGIKGAHLNLTASDTFTASDIYVRGNGSAGWDGDPGGCSSGSGNQASQCTDIGTMNLTHMIFEWNGCVEVKPNGGTVGGNGYNLCYDSDNGGYGEGFTQDNSGGTWTITNSIFRWNVDSGIDVLHISDDAYKPVTSLDLENNWSEGNGGQAYKVGDVSGTETIRNNVAIANCQRLKDPFPPNPSTFNAHLGGLCRALDGWDIGMRPDTKMIFQGNTTAGYESTLYDVGYHLWPPGDLNLTATTGTGTLPAATYYVVDTYTDSAGETQASAEFSIALSATGEITLTAPPSPMGDATGYNVYISTTTGTETKQNATPIALGTNYTQSAPLIAGAALPSSNTATGMLTATLDFRDNITIGYQRTGYDGGQFPGAFYYTDQNPFGNAGSSSTYDIWQNVRAGYSCTGTGVLCADPLLTAESSVDAINILPLSNSPVRGAGQAITGLTADFYGNARPSPPSMGASEYCGSGCDGTLARTSSSGPSTGLLIQGLTVMGVVLQ